MNVTLYSTGCPKCRVLERKLSDAEIEYSLENDVDKMIEKGFKSAPVLEIDGVGMNFKAAIDWVNARQER